MNKKNLKKYAVTAIFFLGSVACNVALSTESQVTPMEQLANHTAPPTPLPTTPATETPVLESSTEPGMITATPKNSAADNATLTPSVINCDYAVPDPISDMSKETIIQWANYAAVHTFTYDFQKYDKQFKALKKCYTTVGWESFVQAMKTSNNLKSAQEEHLFVSAKINGVSQLTAQSKPTEQPAWVVRVPINVTYQNQDREVSQDMYIDLTIKTIYGSPLRLGVNQIVASPKSEHDLM